jgi:hypothetical protein
MAEKIWHEMEPSSRQANDDERKQEREKKCQDLGAKGATVCHLRGESKMLLLQFRKCYLLSLPPSPLVFKERFPATLNSVVLLKGRRMNLLHSRKSRPYLCFMGGRASKRERERAKNEIK